MSERNGFWLKLAAIILPLVAAALIGWGQLRSDVQTLHEQMGTKVDQQVMQVNQAAILRELNNIEDQLSRLEGRR